MSTPESITVAMRRAIVDEGRPVSADLARSILGSRAVTKATLIEAFLPIAIAEMRQIERGRVRAVEKQVDRNMAAPGADPLACRRRLAQETFDIGTGRPVYWLDATAEEHEARAVMQRKMAAGCVSDAERHEDAASTIRANGVTCLRDLDAAAVAS